jgi:hypothetical protein
MKHSTRIAQLEAAVRAKRERNRPRGVLHLTTGERRRRLAELTFIDVHGRDPDVHELNAYQTSSQYEADSRQRDAEFDAWRAAMPGAPTSTYAAFIASEAGKAAV